LEGTKVTLLI